MLRRKTIEIKNRIPRIPEARIEELAERIKPVVRFASGSDGLFKSGQGEMFFIESVDIFKVPFTRSPKPTQKVNGLEPIVDITTYHTFNYYGAFNPTVAEVLAQIPPELLDKVEGFEIVKFPNKTHDLQHNFTALRDGFHVATTRLYRSN